MAEYCQPSSDRFERARRRRRQRSAATPAMESGHRRSRSHGVAATTRQMALANRAGISTTSTPGGRSIAEPALRGEDSLILVPLRNLVVPARPTPGPQTVTPVFGFTIIELNMPYIREQMLPELAARHFTHVEGDVYRVAVTATDDAENVLYRSDPDAPVDPLRADASASLFGMNSGVLSSDGLLVHRLATSTRREEGTRLRSEEPLAVVRAAAPEEELRTLATARATPERLARGGSRTRTAAESRHQLWRAPAPDGEHRAARSNVTARAPTRASADGIRRRRLPRIAHAGRRSSDRPPRTCRMASSTAAIA